MEAQLIISFIGASILLTLMPGPDNIFVLTESLTKGHRNGIAISVGLSTGILIHTLAAATGLSIIIQKSAVAFTTVKFLGAGYLLFLAFKATKDRKPSFDSKMNNSHSDTRFLQLMRKGFIMNVLNPKVSLFFIAFLPQFISNTGFHIIFQMIILGFIFMLQALLIFSLISMLSGKLSKYLNNAKFWQIAKWSKISVLSALAITLAVSKK